MPLTYRGPIVIWLLSNFLNAAVFALLWLSSSGQGTLGGYTRSELVSYYIIAIFLQWIVGLFPFYGIVQEIKKGEIVLNALVKPFSFFGKKLSEEIAWHAISSFIGLAATLILALLFRQYLVLSLSLVKFFVLALATVMTALINFSFSFCLGLLAFWFTEVGAVDGLFWAGRTILGGQGVPISFIPGFYLTLVKVLPFRYLFSFPLEIYFDKLSDQEILIGFLLQIIWITIFVFLYRLMWAKGRRVYTAFGQ